MAKVKYRNPPLPPSGEGTFSDNLVGNQIVDGGGLTLGNFNFTETLTEKTNRTFRTGNFSEPMTLSSMGVESDFFEREILAKNFKVYPNLDLSRVTNFSTFGSLTKRISVSIQKIINYFPAALQLIALDGNFNSGVTVYNIVYEKDSDTTTFRVPIEKIRNPFDIDYTINSARNISLKEIPVSKYRDLNSFFLNYSLYYKDEEYEIISFTPSVSFTTGELIFIVRGRPFGDLTYDYSDFTIRPNSLTTNTIFDESFDEIEKFILNRLITPIYTSVFDTIKVSDSGQFYSQKQKATWPLDGDWNLDIISPAFDSYVEKLGNIAKDMDEFRTNIVSRFLTTGAFKEFDTSDQKVEKILQIYGRSFDDVRKYIDGLANMTSVNYNIGNDVPSALLKNIAQTIGWTTNISPISETEFLESVFKTSPDSNYEGLSRTMTPTELNFQYYRNIILNSAYLFKSKGTRKSIEALLRLIGAPDALVEFNETIYLADGKINMEQFNESFVQISGGTFIQESVVLDPNKTFTFQGKTYTATSVSQTIGDVFTTRDDYPVDENGYPIRPVETEDFYFQKGAGWFEQTPEHRSSEIVDDTVSNFVGQNPDVQTTLKPFSYGEEYFDRFKNFPYLGYGFELTTIVDNNKSYVDTEIGQRLKNNAGYNANYNISDDRLALNRKNIDLYMNPAQGLVYDVWDMSVKNNFPISSQSLFPFSFSNGQVAYSPLYPRNFSNQKIYLYPNNQTFFEFAQSFWRRMINVRDRLYISDGKTGGYPTLQSVYWKYIESLELAGIPNNKFTYQKMIDYVSGLGDYWIRLVEQMIPATTIWRTGIKYENSVFHRQKFVYRRVFNCIIEPIPCKPCEIKTGIFDYGCNNNITSCSLQIDSFSVQLLNAYNKFLSQNFLQASDCQLNTTTSKWFILLMLDNQVLIQKHFFDGVGLNNSTVSFPSYQTWKDKLLEELVDLYGLGFSYYISNDTLFIESYGCDDQKINKKLYLNVGIQLTINCR